MRQRKWERLLRTSPQMNFICEQLLEFRDDIPDETEDQTDYLIELTHALGQCRYNNCVIPIEAEMGLDAAEMRDVLIRLGDLLDQEIDKVKTSEKRVRDIQDDGLAEGSEVDDIVHGPINNRIYLAFVRAGIDFSLETLPSDAEITDRLNWVDLKLAAFDAATEEKATLFMTDGLLCNLIRNFRTLIYSQFHSQLPWFFHREEVTD